MRTLKVPPKPQHSLVIVLDTLDLAQLGEQGAAVQVRVHLAAGRAGRMQGYFGRCAGILNSTLQTLSRNSASSKVRSASAWACFSVAGSSLNSSR